MSGKPARIGGASGYINAGIRHGSSGYFDWNDDGVVQPHSTEKYAVLVSYLREPRLR